MLQFWRGPALREPIRYSLQEDVAVLHFNDGGSNALTESSIISFNDGLDRADHEARAVLLLGRSGCLSHGFALDAMVGQPEAIRAVVRSGAELLMRMYMYPLPLVIGCTGDACAAGALLLLCGDYRVGTQGRHRIGLDESALGMSLPIFAVELARDRLSRTHMQRATSQGEIFTPEQATAAGFLDETAPVDRLVTTALSHAKRLGKLPYAAFSETKQRVRARTAAFIRDTLDEDEGRWGGVA